VAQHAFWIIVDGQTPTSFRSRQREDLVPTLHQLQRKQPQVTLMWFERGRLWMSPTEAREALAVRRRAPAGRPREWRPGGEHADPRAKYAMTRDQKRARFKARADRDRSDQRVQDDKETSKPARAPWRERPGRPAARPPSDFRERARGDRPTPARSEERKGPSARKPKAFGDRPWRPAKPWRPKGPWRPPKPRKS
jgi:hypothetical protein